MINWAILDYDERDFILGGEISLPDILSPTYEYNQLEWKDEYGYCLCTIYAPIWVVSDNTNITITGKQRKELVEQRYNLPDFDANVWWLLSEGINITRKYYKSIWYKVSSLRINTKEDLFNLLDKWYRVNIWMIVKDDFIEDTQKDWILNSTPIWNPKYGHSTSIKKIWDNFIIDNYKWTHTYNKILINDLQNLIDEWIIYEWAFVLFLDKSNIINNKKKQLMEDIKLESAKAFVSRWYTNWERPQDNITREEMWAIFERVLIANNLK